jgi:uncharacterized protein YndB with AHSA1/START domain
MAKFIFLVASLSMFGLLTPLSAQQLIGNYADKIVWPSAYLPSESKFFVHNEIDINASPEVVWHILIDALQWETWYEGAKQVTFDQTNGTTLGSQTVFQWQTMGLQFQTTIQAFEPNRYLAWESRKKSIQGYHIWLILPTEFGCTVITQESQNGWLTFLEKIFQPNKLKKMHDRWLYGLKKKAEATTFNSHNQ